MELLVLGLMGAAVVWMFASVARRWREAPRRLPPPRGGPYRGVRLVRGADGFRVETTTAHAGRKLRYRYREGDRVVERVVALEHGPEGQFVYTGSEPTDLEVVAIEGAPPDAPSRENPPPDAPPQDAVPPHARHPEAYHHDPHRPPPAAPDPAPPAHHHDPHPHHHDAHRHHHDPHHHHDAHHHHHDPHHHHHDSPSYGAPSDAASSGSDASWSGGSSDTSSAADPPAY